MGSIPACAGEPLGDARQLHAIRVYPRVCGGTFVAITKNADDQGLSPRVRGNLVHAKRGRAYFGSIPACAGEPRPPSRRTGSTRVYPRVCGGTTV